MDDEESINGTVTHGTIIGGLGPRQARVVETATRRYVQYSYGGRWVDCNPMQAATFTKNEPTK